jgi:hypothetical protein
MRAKLQIAVVAAVFIVTSVATDDAAAKPGTPGVTTPAPAKSPAFKKGRLGKSLPGKKDMHQARPKVSRTQVQGAAPAAGQGRATTPKPIRQSAVRKPGSGTAVRNAPRAALPGAIGPKASPKAPGGQPVAKTPGATVRPIHKSSRKPMVKAAHHGAKLGHIKPKTQRPAVGRSTSPLQPAGAANGSMVRGGNPAVLVPNARPKLQRPQQKLPRNGNQPRVTISDTPVAAPKSPIAD